MNLSSHLLTISKRVLWSVPRVAKASPSVILNPVASPYGFGTSTKTNGKCHHSSFVYSISGHNINDNPPVDYSVRLIRSRSFSLLRQLQTRWQTRHIRNVVRSVRKKNALNTSVPTRTWRNSSHIAFCANHVTNGFASVRTQRIVQSHGMHTARVAYLKKREDYFVVTFPPNLYHYLCSSFSSVYLR